jgi:hypothetical protein
MWKRSPLPCTSADIVVEACQRFAGAMACLARAPSRGANLSFTRKKGDHCRRRQRWNAGDARPEVRGSDRTMCDARIVWKTRMT